MKKEITFIRTIQGIDILAPMKRKKDGQLSLYRPLEIIVGMGSQGIPMINLVPYLVRDYVNKDWIGFNPFFTIIIEKADKNISALYWKILKAHDKMRAKVKKQIKQAQKEQLQNKKEGRPNNPIPKDQRVIDLSDPKYSAIKDTIEKSIKEEKEELVEENKGKKSILKN
jgi:hypothetical protein